MSILVGMGLGSWIARARQNGEAHQAFDDIVKDVMTDENKSQVEQLIKYHNSRVAAGADGQVSYERLVKDLKQLKEETQDESGAPE